MKRLSLTMICAALIFAACEQDTTKAPLAPPEMVDTEDGKNDMISYMTDIVGEFKYYGETITGDAVLCRRCKTPHHQDCWQYYGACSTYGCRETRYLRPGAKRAKRAREGLLR